MVTEDQIEEALSVGMVRHLHGVFTTEAARVQKVLKYSTVESAPAHHGLFVTFESGETFEITIRRT